MANDNFQQKEIHRARAHSGQALAESPGVPVEAAVRDAVGLSVAGQRPDDERLVARRGQQGVRGVERGRDGGDPAGVALEGAAESERFLRLRDGGGRGGWEEWDGRGAGRV